MTDMYKVIKNTMSSLNKTKGLKRESLTGDEKYRAICELKIRTL